MLSAGVGNTAVGNRFKEEQLMYLPQARKWGIADGLICAVVAVAIAALAWHTKERLNYRWDWQTPLKYLVNMQEDGWSGGLLLDGLLMSVRLMVIGGILALCIGAAVALLAISSFAAFRGVARFYIESLRHLPPIVFMFVFFYFISAQLFDAQLWQGLLQYTDNAAGRLLLGDPARAENLIGGVLCLAIFESAFVAEILRAGILSIHSEQWQAARSLGLSSIKILRLVIFPQALARVAAPLVGQLVLLVKDSAILSVISVQELAFSAQETAVSTQQIFETWLLVALLYFMLCAPLLWWSHKLERVRG